MRGTASETVTERRSVVAMGTPQRVTTRDRTAASPASPSWMIRCSPVNMVLSGWVSSWGAMGRGSSCSSTVETTSRGQDCSTVRVKPASKGVPNSAASRAARSSWSICSSSVFSSSMPMAGVWDSRISQGFSSWSRSWVMENRSSRLSRVSPS